MPIALSETRIGQRVRFRDLQVFFAVVQCGSMGKAAAQLGVTQPAVSELISGLESTIGVRLFDRTSQGVEPTIYGRALLKRGIAAFDEFKQGLRDIEFLANPTVGEVRVGCPEFCGSGNPSADDPEILSRVSGNCIALRSGADPHAGFARPPRTQTRRRDCLAINSSRSICRRPECGNPFRRRRGHSSR